MRIPNPTLVLLVPTLFLPTLFLSGALGLTEARAEKPKKGASPLSLVSGSDPSKAAISICDRNLQAIILPEISSITSDQQYVESLFTQADSALFADASSSQLDATPSLGEFIQTPSHRDSYLRYRANLVFLNSPRVNAFKEKLLMKVKALIEKNATEEEIISETKALIASDRKVAWIFSNSGRTSLSADSREFYESYERWKAIGTSDSTQAAK